MLKINQFDFQKVWDSPDYISGDVRYIGAKVRGIPVYTGKNEKGPFVGFADNSFVSFVSESMGKLFPHIQFYGTRNEIILLVQLMDLEMDTYFSVFAAALVSEIENSSDDEGEVIRRYCREWEVLFHEPKTVQRVVGLVGELFFLAKVLEDGIGDVCWNLGMGSPQDFIIGGKTLVEVKTTCSHSGYSVEVHGIEQLECPTGKRLHLVFVRMVKVKDGDFSITKLLERIPQKYIGQEAQKELDSISGEMKNMNFDCIEVKDYRVSDSFPCLTRKSIGLLPHSDCIVDVDYRINLQNQKGSDIGVFLDSLKDGYNL